MGNSLSTDESVESIAAELGYSDARSLRRFHKAAMGTTPRQIRPPGHLCPQRRWGYWLTIAGDRRDDGHLTDRLRPTKRSNGRNRRA
ncbi:AraC family transcriptional regulator [Bradyrhizobium sp. USDA 10063]